MKITNLFLVTALFASSTAFAIGKDCSDTSSQTLALIALENTTQSIPLGSQGITAKAITNCKPYWMAQALGLDVAPVVPNDSEICGVQVVFVDQASQTAFAKKLFNHSVNHDGNLRVDLNGVEYEVPVCGYISGTIDLNPGATVSN